MLKRKSIIIFAPFYLPHIGGLENYIKEFIFHLPTSDFNIIVLAPLLPTGSPFVEKPTSNIKIIRYPAVEPIHNFPIPKFWSPSFWKCWRNISSQPYDVVISHTRFFISSFLALIFSRFKKVKLIHIEHGSDFVQAGSKTIDLMSKIYDYTFGKLVLLGATDIIAISSAVEKFIKLLSGRNSEVIFRGLEFEDIEKCSANPKWEVAYPNKTIFISVSRLIKWKGLKRNLKAFTKLSKAELTKITYVIAGDGPERRELEAFAKENKLPVVFTGAISRNEVFSLIKASDVFIHGSMPGGGLSTTLIEAMYCKLPIIATPHEGASDIIEHLNNGYMIDSSKEEDLAEAIKWHINNPQKAAEHGQKARLTVIENFSWDKNIEKIIKLI